MRHWQRQGEYAVIFLDRLRAFGRANILTAAGILLALFAYYFVLAPAEFGESEEGQTVTSPDGRYSVSVGPPLVSNAGREGDTRAFTITVRGSDSTASRTIASTRLAGFVEARWSSNSRFVAIVTAPGRTTGVMIRVLAVETEGTSDLSLPTSVDPAVLLAGEDTAAVLQTGNVRLLEWRGDTLSVVSMAHGWVGPATEEGSFQVGIQCYFDLAVSVSRIRELSRDC